jgi:hypothetical protein
MPLVTGPELALQVAAAAYVTRLRAPPLARRLQRSVWLLRLNGSPLPIAAAAASTDLLITVAISIDIAGAMQPAHASHASSVAAGATAVLAPASKRWRAPVR